MPLIAALNITNAMQPTAADALTNRLQPIAAVNLTNTMQPIAALELTNTVFRRQIASLGCRSATASSTVPP